MTYAVLARVRSFVPSQQRSTAGRGHRARLMRPIGAALVRSAGRRAMRRNLGAWCLLGLLVFAALGLTKDAARAADFRGLGVLSGGIYSRANGVSADGSVVVGQGDSAAALDEAFRWTAGGGMVPLGCLPGGTYSYGFGVSADGSVVVGQGNSALGYQAFRWTAAGGMVGLGWLPGGSYSYGQGVSADGSVVVGYGTSASGDQAFRWTAAGGMVGLGYLPGAESYSYGYGVSADGSVVVGYGNSASGVEAFRWTAGGGMVGLGDLTGGNVNSRALAASRDGSVVVGVGVSASGYEAFRWTATTGMVGLGDLPGGSFESFATGVCADGSVVVGYSKDGTLWYSAFVWDQIRGMQSLKDLLVTEFGLTNLEGWTLERAQGISADGLTIVGFGVNSGHMEAFRVNLDGVTRSWVGAASGSWDQPGNWSKWGKPGPLTTVRIDPLSAASVAGPAAAASVESLTIGARSSGIATLTLDGTSLSVTNALTIQARGRLDLNTGTLSAGSITNDGAFNQATGTSLSAGSLLNTGTATLGGEVSLSTSLENQGTLTLQSGANVTVAGSGLTNLGTLTLDGGTVSGILLTNEAGGQMTARGTLSASLNNYGDLIVSGTLKRGGAVSNYGQISIASGRDLGGTGPFYNFGIISLDGGGISGQGIQTYAGGVIQGHGAITTVTAGNQGGLIYAKDGLLTILGLNANSNGGELRVAAGSTLNLGCDFSSYGLITLEAQSARLGGAAVITNTGSIVGCGQVSNTIHNSGIIRAENGQLTLSGATNTNTSTGQIQVPFGTALFLSQGLATNAGSIALVGGTFDTNNTAITNGGTIAGNGTIRTRSLTNSGQIRIADANTAFYGSVTNSGSIAITENTTTFFGYVTNTGTITTTNATVRYLGGGSGLPAGFINAGNTNLAGTSTTIVQNGNGDVQQTGGSLALDNGATLNARTVSIEGGTISAGGPDALVTASLAYTSPASSTFQGILDGAGKTLTLNNSAATLTLSGRNRYTGATTVAAGTLRISGSSSDTSGVTVDAGAVLELARAGGSALAATTPVSNDGMLNVATAGQLVGALDGIGTTTVAAGANLTANYVQQDTLEILGGGTLTIRPTTLGSGAAGGVAAEGQASQVPEPSVLALLTAAALCLLPLRRRLKQGA